MRRALLRLVVVVLLVATGVVLPACTSTGSTPVNVGVSVRYGYGYGPGWGYGWGGSYRPPMVPIGPPIYSGPSGTPMFEEDN